MIVIEYDGIELDYCVGCLGVWFDAGEIDLLLEKAGVGGGVESRMFTEADSSVRELKRPCPLCGKVMRKVSPPRGHVILDECPDGEGIWFDAGEIRDTLAVAENVLDPSALDVLHRFLGKALADK
ncbi:MAG TPA: zf-TFIIB domain-containing protein [bacterium]|nr:zf-TFIIB domain-containing protein [bacterium]